MPTTIHTVASTDMHPQLDNPFSDRLAVTEISCLYLAQPNADTSLCNFIAQSAQPVRERLTPVVALVAKEFNHVTNCSLKATFKAVRHSCHGERPLFMRSSRLLNRQYHFAFQDSCLEKLRLELSCEKAEKSRLNVQN